MSKSKLLKSLDISRTLLRSQIDVLREEAEELITNYWIEWKERNHIERSLARIKTGHLVTCRNGFHR